MARVTVINDSSEFLALMRDLLNDLGHEMIGHESVKASIDGIVDEKPDLLIIDLRLGDTPQEVSGWELLVLARSHRQLRSVPVILCSADVWELKRRAEDLERVAGVYVRTKPFDIDEMGNLINRLLEAGPVASMVHPVEGTTLPSISSP
jgi:DNA-binding response OmpR family regulator